MKNSKAKTMAAIRIIFSLLLFPSVTSAAESCRNVYSESGHALVDHAYKSFFTRRLASCYMSCNTQPTCQSLNYKIADKTCELNNDTKYFRPKYFVRKPAFVYAENLDSGRLQHSFFLPWNMHQSLCINFIALWFLLIRYMARLAFRKLNT